MTVCTTLGAVILTPLLTKILAGTYVPVDAVKISISTMQVVVAPILLGSYMQSAFPEAVKVGMPIAPLLAVLAASLLASTYLSAALVRFKKPQQRAISVEVGMQNSSLGVVLSSSYFTSPMVALPPAVSAVIMNIMGGSLGFIWRYIDPSDPKDSFEVAKGSIQSDLHLDGVAGVGVAVSKNDRQNIVPNILSQAAFSTGSDYHLSEAKAIMLLAGETSVSATVVKNASNISQKSPACKLQPNLPIATKRSLEPFFQQTTRQVNE
ncbi:unnamed protein product [Fraxinus pennsylvanica]|uniref:Uncharacterized protein n=1 Tax=Fraxinus pennsylvanica TaxID=56036 RepID=A0AAD2DWF0_9LAMI|nr:unnamed protein product [Fraxinus pennsylvanica]